jgi:hypothetical protein
MKVTIDYKNGGAETLPVEGVIIEKDYVEIFLTELVLRPEQNFKVSSFDIKMSVIREVRIANG